MVTLLFLDSSALVKRYVNETGSDWVRSITAPQTNRRLFIARITWVEVLAAFARLRREGVLSLENVTAVTQTFRYDFDTQYQLIELDQSLTQLAGTLAQKHPLRAYDSVQLASAVKLQPILTQFPNASLTFITGDGRLLAIAQAEGLQTNNPNDHP